MLKKFFEKQVKNYNYNKCVFFLQCIFTPFIMYGIINLTSETTKIILNFFLRLIIFFKTCLDKFRDWLKIAICNLFITELFICFYC